MRLGLSLGISSPAAPWSPALAPSLAAWYALGGVILTSSAVSTWTDYGPHGLHLTQSTASKRPTVSNGVVFDGVDDLLTAAAPSLLTTSYTIAAVVRPTQAEASQGYIVSSIDAGFVGGVALIAKPERSLIHASISTASIGALTTSKELWLAKFSAPTLSFALNGVAQSITGAPATFATCTAGNILSFGSFATGIVPAHVAIYEVAIYTSALSAANTASLTSYLMRKHGLS